MENQLANSSCLVGSLDRFLDIAEHQNENSDIHPCNLHRTSPSPERKTNPKRRTTSAKLRLSQINPENVHLIEQRITHRDKSVKKIQNMYRKFLHRRQTRREVVKRSESIVHYHVLTHLLKQQHSKKRKSIRKLQGWWRQHLSSHRAAIKFAFIQQGRWTLRQANLVKALMQGYRVRTVLTQAKKQPIKSAVMLLINANEVLEGICDDINTNPLVLDSILTLDRTCAMTRSLLIYCSLHRLDPRGHNPRRRKSKVDETLISNFSVYQRLMSQLPVEWAFVDNFVREILQSRNIISDYFSKDYKKKSTIVKSSEAKTLSKLRPSMKENRKVVHVDPNIAPSNGDDGCRSKSPLRDEYVAGQVKAEYATSHRGSTDIFRQRALPDDVQQPRDHINNEKIDQDGANSDIGVKVATPLVPKSLLSLLRESPPQRISALPRSTYHVQPSHDNSASVPSASIAISPLQCSPLSQMTSPNISYHSPKRSTRVIPADLCSPQSTNNSANNSSGSIISSVGLSPQRQLAAIPSVPVPKPQYSSKPHLQIDIVCAECLGTVSAARRSRNQATRKPGLKITVCMPAAVPDADSNGDVSHSEMKVVQTTSYVSLHEISPTDPVWNYTVYCPLRVPPSLEFAEFDTVVSSYWSLGTVKIEVVDSERFNEDIFLGDVTLFLSKFLLQKPTKTSSSSSSSASPLPVREISGSFSIMNNTSVGTSVTASGLKSKHATNNGSGSGSKLTAAVYLHKPSSNTPSRHSRRPTYPPLRKAAPHHKMDNSASVVSSEAHPPTKDMKSALAHIPSQGTGGLTASARRHRRASSMEVANESVNTNTIPKRDVSLLSTALHDSPPPPVPHTPPSNNPSASTPGSGRRRRSLENVGTILDFLQDALQEEAEATVESLKQNYASCKKKEAKEEIRSTSQVHSSAAASSSSSSSSAHNISSSPPSSTASSFSTQGQSGAADDINMETVQNDLDDIMGALQRRMLAKAKPS